MSKITAFDNITEGEALSNDMVAAFEDVRNILVHHAGPYAGYGVIGSHHRQANDIDEHTKDGIKIFRHLIVSTHPCHRFAARMARFVGIAVDHRCHDGTTTSMLAFANLGIMASEMITSSESRWQKHASTDLQKVLEGVLNYTKTLRITMDELLERCLLNGLDVSIQDVRKAVAYHMAMISSKGDHELSEMVADVIENSPQKLYGQYRINRASVESPVRYTKFVQDYDVQLRANIGDINTLNYRLDTEYCGENAVIFMTGTELVPGTMESRFLTALISKAPRHRANLEEFGMQAGWEDLAPNRPLVIMAPMISDHELMEAIHRYNAHTTGPRIVYFSYQVKGRSRTCANRALHAISGTTPFNELKGESAIYSLIGLTDDTGPTVRYMGTALRLYNLYEKDGGHFHPSYVSPERDPNYTAYREELESVIEYNVNTPINPSLDPDELTFFITMYREMICQKVVDIQVGGFSHEKESNLTVYEDVIGSVVAALEHGVVLGGYGHIVKYLNRFKDDMSRSVRRAFFETLYASLRPNNRDTLSDTIATLTNRWGYILATDTTSSGIKKCQLRDGALARFIRMDRNAPVLVQAYVGYEEQLYRFVDILPKLANSYSLIDMRVENGNDFR